MQPTNQDRLQISNTTYGSRWIFQVRPIRNEKQGRILTIPQLPLAVFLLAVIACLRLGLNHPPISIGGMDDAETVLITVSAAC
jgi:hypothetical protein